MENKNNSLNVSEIFQSIQGEGVSIGKNVIFIRLGGCNLNCNFCDSKYHKNYKPIGFELLKFHLLEMNSKTIVFTGGEPLLQEKEIIEFIKYLDDNQYSYEFETNGTIIPSNLIKFIVENNLQQHVRFNISPKLENSGNSISIHSEVLKYFSYDVYNENKIETIFKFVVDPKIDDYNMVYNIVFNIISSFPSEKIYLMPKGKKRSEQIKKSPKIINECIKMGLSFSPRAHVLIWDNKKGV